MIDSFDKEGGDSLGIKLISIEESDPSCRMRMDYLALQLARPYKFLGHEVATKGNAVIIAIFGQELYILGIISNDPCGDSESGPLCKLLSETNDTLDDSGARVKQISLNNGWLPTHRIALPWVMPSGEAETIVEAYADMGHDIISENDIVLIRLNTTSLGDGFIASPVLGHFEQCAMPFMKDIHAAFIQRLSNVA